MRTVALPDGERIVKLGQGTWFMGEDARAREAEITALRHGIDLGLNLIDTAEMYAEGGAERIVGEAITGRRDNVFIVSKVYPWNASRDGVVEACERSLGRLQIDTIDLYLLHWPGNHPLGATLEGFERLRSQGKIRHWGVSNFDTALMTALGRVPGGERVAVDQILYNLEHRGPEIDLLPWCRAAGVPVMAYSPLEQARLRVGRALRTLAEKHRSTPWQIALAWVLSVEGVIAIPKASRIEHIEANRAALDITLDDTDLALLDEDYPRPPRAVPLEML